VPKCLDCDNVTKFSYMENSYNEATYSAAGDLLDVDYKEHYDPADPKCMECQSTRVEGTL
jgi:hypothetical protein